MTACIFFFQAEDGIRDLVRSRGLGDVYKRQTEGVTLDFKADGVRRLAELAFSVNETTENIGARRLYTVMEKLLEEVAFDAGSHGKALTIDTAYVDARLKDLAQSEDLARYVL